MVRLGAALFAMFFVVPGGFAVAGDDSPPAGAVLDVGTWMAMAQAGTLPSDCALDPADLVQRDLEVRPGVVTTGAATPDDCGGIRPGAVLSNGCTMNFVFASAADLFIGTAGHCAGVGQRMSAPGIGQFGTVAYSSNGGLGNDFALIRIDASKRAQTSPTLCTWGGPLGASAGQLPFGEVVHEYGWGIATEFTSLTRGRAHLAAGQNANSVNWVGVGSGGDSGAPLTDGQDRALAIHTHGITPLVGVIGESGTYIHRALAMAASGGVPVSLVSGAADPSDPLPIDSPYRYLFAEA